MQLLDTGAADIGCAGIGRCCVVFILADGGIGEIAYPLVADLTKDIARDYGVLVDDAVSRRLDDRLRI